MTIGAGTGGPWEAKNGAASCSLTVGETIVIFVVMNGGSGITCDGVTVAGASNGAATERGTPAWEASTGNQVHCFTFENLGTGGTQDVSVDGWTGGTPGEYTIWVYPYSDAAFDDVVQTAVTNGVVAGTFSGRTANSTIVSVIDDQWGGATPTGYTALTKNQTSWGGGAAERANVASDVVTWAGGSNYGALGAISLVTASGGGGGRIMSSLANFGGLAGLGGLAGPGGGLAA